MERKELLTHLSFGTQVAEDERKELARYFVETDQWRRISNDEIDVIRGEKGSGKRRFPEVMRMIRKRQCLMLESGTTGGSALCEPAISCRGLIRRDSKGRLAIAGAQ